MQIGITNPLRSFLHWKPFPPNGECDSLWCWDAHRVSVDGRILLVLCNASNRFCCVTAMRGAEWHRLSSKCLDLIEEALLDAGFAHDAVEAYLSREEGCSFGRTHGRKAVGCMNRAIDKLLYLRCDRTSQFQSRLSRMLNDEMCHCASRAEYGTPAEWMAEDMRAYGIEPFPSAQISVVSENNASEDEAVQRPGACMVCGKDARVFIGSDAYCLSCYNKMTGAYIGAPEARDDSVLVAFDKEGKAIQFAVERFLTPVSASWTAREMMDRGDTRSVTGYVGIEVSLYASPYDDPDKVLARLQDRVQEVLSHPSTSVDELPMLGYPSFDGVHVLRRTYAEDEGWGRFDVDDYGERCIVVDGQRYNAEEFFALFSSYEGFELHWSMYDKDARMSDVRPDA